MGALLWAGCASQSQSGLKRVRQPEPVNLTRREVDTHPELRTGQNRIDWSIIDMSNANPPIRFRNARP